ncbi:uncharacterized protein LTR77_002798 [Saxophila tyrrhenica]|uniref:RecQ-mediated genome instability protein 1 n=1 Tax=Saxophila tyrrhenica TaxID=1690608 RepID=A0AAV9PHA7_9PEZI|nr:hypothetical protein LTR77_002798 [Saxophila tyrrhenica]
MATAPAEAEVKATVVRYLASKNVPPTQAWLRDFMPSIRLNTPMVALQKTALFRILSTDLTVAVQPPSPNALFPANVASPEVKDRKLNGQITVQVLDIEDIGHSCWSQVENLEAIERGEMTKGREVIRVVDDELNTDQNRTPANNPSISSGPHKLLIQDAKGTKAFAFESEFVTGIGVSQLSIGGKLVLNDALVARGVIMLDRRAVEVLGGKVEAWDKKWRADRKESLKRKAGVTDGAGGGT